MDAKYEENFRNKNSVIVKVDQGITPFLGVVHFVDEGNQRVLAVEKDRYSDVTKRFTVFEEYRRMYNRLRVRVRTFE